MSGSLALSYRCCGGAEAAEMTATVGFLASDEAAYITGMVLPVDGGISL